MNHIQERNQGFIDITNPHPFGVHDMYNAYFDMNVSMDVMIIAGDQAIPANTIFFVGFKNAFDIIDRFVWKVSGTDVQTEINCHKFGTLHNLVISQDVREKNPYTYTSSEILNRSEAAVIGKCGAYIKNGTEIPTNSSSISRSVSFKLMIPMIMFDIFATIRYHPRAFGEWLFTFIPTSSNCVWGVLPSAGDGILPKAQKRFLWQQLH